MDNSAFLSQFGGNDTASSIYQGLIACNGNELDIFSELRKDGTSKLIDDPITQEDLYLIEDAAVNTHPLGTQAKYSDSFFDVETKFTSNDKKEMKNEEMSDHLQDIYDLIINDNNHLTRRENVKTETTDRDRKKSAEGRRPTTEDGDAETRLKLAIRCTRCNSVVGGRRDFALHWAECRPGGVAAAPLEFACPLCDKSFTNYLSFRTHWYRHMPHKHKCPYCDKGFGLRSKLSSHVIALHSDHRPHICKTCNKGYASLSSLNCHQKTHAQRATRDLSCHICHKAFVTEASLRRHVQLHKTGRSFMCEVCGERFLYKSHLVYHTDNSHAKSRPFVCDKCGKKFAALVHLRRHWKMHDEGRPFKCSECSKTFKTKHCLSHHRRRHSTKRPFVCTHCEKGFIKMSKLQEHVNTHTGNRPYVCTWCQRAFTNQANMIKHTRRIHKKKETSPSSASSSSPVAPIAKDNKSDSQIVVPSEGHHRQSSVDLLVSTPHLDTIDQNLSFLDELTFFSGICPNGLE